MEFLDVLHISRLEDGRPVLEDISFSQQPLQNIAIAGATGSGKSTLLKIIGGLATPTMGQVNFKGERVKGPTERLLPGHPAIAYLSQHFELRNHYRVRELLEMACKVENSNASHIYEVCRIAYLLHRWTHQLSGGEKQRIALARLLVAAPELLLLDEPFSNLDPFHKNILKDVLEDLQANLSVSLALVSHDPQDALAWADNILVLNDGRLVQQGSPNEVYAQPADEYVAALFGKYTVLTMELAKALLPYADFPLNKVGSFLRPQAFRLVNEGEGLPATVAAVRFMGGFTELALAAAGTQLTVFAKTTNLKKGEQVSVSLAGTPE